MKILVTGSAGHLGEALVRHFRRAHDVTGLDRKSSPCTDRIGSIADREFVRQAVRGMDAVVHAATLHKPHVATHEKSSFVETNVQGTLNLLEAATGVFVFTSTTSVFGRAMTPSDGRAVWVDEELVPVPRNIYGVTKAAAEDLCELAHRERGLPCLVLRTSRFFPELDDARRDLPDENIKANEYLYRRVDIEDVVAAHDRAIAKVAEIGFAKYVITATTPFTRTDCEELLRDAPSVVAKYFPEYAEIYARREWRMFPAIERVYSNAKARRELGWQPRYDFAHVLKCLKAGESPLSPTARLIGSKGYA